MSGHFEKNVIVSGIGMSEIGRKTGIPGLELTRQAATGAIGDAGLRPADIDGVATLGDVPPQDVAADLGLSPDYTGGGHDSAGLLSPLVAAMLAVAGGRARHVLVYRTVLMLGGSVLRGARTPMAAAGATAGGSAPAGGAMADMPRLLVYHAYAAPHWLALHCQRHMHLYGTTREQLGWLAIESREKARLNPRAALRAPLTMDDYLNARPVSTPFGLYDCDVPVDGSIALVISRRDFAGDCPSPVYVEAAGGADGSGSWLRRADFPNMASVDAASEMWSRTDLTPADIDMAQLYDGFTYIALAWLEALGFCAAGESGPFVEGGARIALDGKLPLNTYGGQLSAGRMHGYWVVHEACLQLRGQADGRQVAKHETAVVGAGGGPFADALLLTR